VGTRCADHVTPLYPQKLALISPTGGGRSVGIVRSRTKATEFSFIPQLLPLWMHINRWLSPTSEFYGSASPRPFYTFSKLLLASEKLN